MKKSYKRNLTPQAIERMREGGRNRAKQFTHEYQSRVGKLGYQACKQTHPELAGGFAAEWRKANPSGPEKQVMAWLDAHRVNYTREAFIEGYYVDFLLPGKLVLEVYGEVWHTDHQFHGRQAEAYDRKRNRILAQAGYTVVILPEQDIESGKSKTIVDRLAHDIQDW